jgi:hypothetical protein
MRGTCAFGLSDLARLTAGASSAAGARQDVRGTADQDYCAPAHVRTATNLAATLDKLLMAFGNFV